MLGRGSWFNYSHFVSPKNGVLLSHYYIGLKSRLLQTPIQSWNGQSPFQRFRQSTPIDCLVPYLYGWSFLNGRQTAPLLPVTPLVRCHPRMRFSYGSSFRYSRGPIIGSAPRFQTLLTESPSLVLTRCQSGHEPSGIPTLAVSYYNQPRRRPLDRVIATLTLSKLRFQCREIPKPVTYPTRSFIELPINDIDCHQRLGWSPDSTLKWCRYTVELSKDPEFLQVPSSPGFPSCPCAISDASSALVSGTCHPLSVGPTGRTFTYFHITAGHTSISSGEPFPCRPIPSRQYLGGVSRRKEFHLPALSVAWRA